MLSGSSSTRSSRLGTIGSGDWGSQDAHSYNRSLLEHNLLDDEVDRPSLAARPKAPTHPSKPMRRGREVASNSRFVIAVDYGTTFTGAAVIQTQSDFAILSDIDVFVEWLPGLNLEKVPSVISYSPPVNDEAQWGPQIATDAVTMVNTKLELEVQAKKIDELELTLQVLEGTGGLAFDHVKRSGAFPEYTWKTPTEIVTDYLTKVSEHVWDEVKRNLPTEIKATVDIVVTVPVKWSYQATNATFRAIQDAGFNKETYPTLKDMILVTEPEAASYFTTRYFQETGTKVLKVGEHFILCDAGGGTVDLISYQVKQLEPHLEILQTSMPTSDRCGAAHIDMQFKHWLRGLIGKKAYRLLDTSSAAGRLGTHTTESGPMRELIKAFDVEKKRFSNGAHPIKIDLPYPLDTLTIEGKVEEGEITIEPEEMKAMFNPSVSKVIALIEGQRQQVERKNNRRVKNVFLVGGFGESPYLQEELQKSLKLRSIKMLRPKTKESWTAVVRGAAVYGVEKSRHRKKLRLMSMAERSYGIVIDEAFTVHKSNPRDCFTDLLTNMTMARRQFAWMIRKKDLILSDEKKIEKKEFTLPIQTDDRRKFDMPVYTYPDEDDDVPDRWENGKYEVEQVGCIKCDMSSYSPDEFEWSKNHQTGESYYVAFLVCKMMMTTTTLEAEVLLNEKRIGYTQINLDEPASRRSSIDSWE